MKTCSQVVEKVSQFYIPGTIEFYGRQKSDLWAEMIDRFDAAISSGDPKIIESGALEYLATAIDLSEKYKIFKSPNSPPTFGDYFMMAPERIKIEQSIRYKECYKCGTRNDLLPESFGKNRLEVRIVCRKHKELKS